ncbi:pyrroline-5-carboxylate reductase [Streptomyces sp. MBT53]|uniref:pyrroline-5-carboxylate reductase family protein n=1 Tax=Streptomyces sp. MBT53 TaxID=1488384 RepID=UPI0019123B7A|nr:pyrroline-5-carboxylate reductase dimerization domain-containing protein [Streptomyces sp. MBT53]MBK6015428.1 NAD(P)-binding domain-containing protein [Streptomyces sp. MBT53]
MTEPERADGRAEPGGPAPLVVVVGAGHLGRAVLMRLLTAGHPAGRLCAVTRTAEQARLLADRCSCQVTADSGTAADGADVLVLTVRPEQARAVLARTAPRLAEGAAVVSFVAGLSLAGLREVVGTRVHCLRAATNAVSVGRGGTVALTPDAELSATDGERLASLLSALGTVVRVPEAQQDMAASTLGSGAAFLAAAAAGVVAAADAVGVEGHTARLFAADALESAAVLIRRAEHTGQPVWHELATPGGITRAGLDVLRAHGIDSALAEAVAAAVARAAELSAAAERNYRLRTGN